MGCKICVKKEEMNTEVENGIEQLPNQLNNKDDIINIDYNMINMNGDFNGFNQDTHNTAYINIEQERNDDIFNFFNNLRNNPKNYIEQARHYDLEEIINLAEDKKNSVNIRTLIKNPFYNLFLDTYVKKYPPNSTDEILFNLESNIQLRNYKKELYYSEADAQAPNEAIWNFLKINKSICIDEILYKNFDYFIVSSIYIPDTQSICFYFLFLTKKL